MRWEIFESAPKDGTSILVYGPEMRTNGGMAIAMWFDGDIEFWHIEDGKKNFYPLRGPMPTHWSHLPEPPLQI